MASCYRVLKALCIVLNLVMYTLLLVMNYASNNKSGILFGNKSLAQMARKYYTEFNPAPWAFEIWKLVNAWTSLWILYSLTHIRRNVPDVLTPLFFVCFTMASVFNMAWTQFTSWDIINPATGFVFAILIFLYATLFCSYSGLYKQRYYIRRSEFWFIQLFLNNGIAVYATWVTVAALRSLALNMTYRHGIRQEYAVTTVLGILALWMVIFFILENTLFKEHLLYTLTVYPVLIWAFVTSVIFNLKRVSRTNNALMEVLLAVSCTFFVGKIFLLIWNVVRRNREIRAAADITMSEMPKTDQQHEKYTDKSEGREVFV